MNSKEAGEGAAEDEVKKSIDFFGYKQQLLSIVRDENKTCSACPKDNF